MSPRVILVSLIAALVLWGGMLAAGVMINDEGTGTGLIKAAIVGGCMTLFLAFWGAMFLLHRKPKPMSKESDDLPQHDEAQHKQG